MDRYDRIRQALARVPAHSYDPDAAREAGEAALVLFAADERDVLSAVAAYPCTALELELVFPQWRPMHAAKRLSQLKTFGMVDTSDARRPFPGHRIASSVYHATPTGQLIAPAWPAGNTPVDVTIRDGISMLRHDQDPDRGWFPCLYCNVRRPTRAGAILHEQRAHGIPRLDPTTLRPVAA